MNKAISSFRGDCNARIDTEKDKKRKIVRYEQSINLVNRLILNSIGKNQQN